MLALNMSSYCSLYDAYLIMDKITENLCKADLAFGLRPALEKFGFSSEEDIFIVFQYKDKEYKTDALPPVTIGKATTLSRKSIKAATVDWLNKAEIQFPFNEAVGKKLGIKPEGEFEVPIKFVSKSNEYVLRGGFCWPCSPAVP